MDEATRALLPVEGGLLEVFTARADAPWSIAAAHPADPLSAGSAALLARASGVTTRVVNPRGLGGSSPVDAAPTLEAMVDDLEAVRRALGLAPWIYWGMSGGGFLGQLYAQRHPEGLRALIVESAAPCFRASVADPSSILSPANPIWRGDLAAAGLRPADADHDHDAPAGWRALAADRWAWCAGDVARLIVPATPSPTMKRAMPEIWRFDARAGLSAITTPTLVIAGEADPIAPLAHVRQVHASIPGARFVVIAGGGHVPVAEGHAELDAAVHAFLAALA